MLTSRTSSLAIALTLAVGLGACGDDDDQSTASSTTGTQQRTVDTSKTCAVNIAGRVVRFDGERGTIKLTGLAGEATFTKDAVVRGTTDKDDKVNLRFEGTPGQDGTASCVVGAFSDGR